MPVLAKMPNRPVERVSSHSDVLFPGTDDLRRTFGSYQAGAGVSLHVIGKSMGHKNQSTTAIYARLAMDPVRAGVTAGTTAMLEAAKNGAGK